MASITFIGAAGVVTGSKHLLQFDSGTRVLLDCGLFQGPPDLTARNWLPPPLNSKDLDAVLLSHGHLDHCGYLPALVAEGFEKPIYCTSATADVAALVLRDSAGLQEDEAARAAKHPDRGLHATPLYTNADVDKVIPLFSHVEYGVVCQSVQGCTFRFQDAGHILGSEIMEIFYDQRKLVFSGDLGRYGRPLLRDPSPIAQADYLLCESTYGDRLHPQTNPQDDLAAVINAAHQRNGVLVIPCFAIGRTQEILYAIGQLQAGAKIPKVAIYVDSPMGISADTIMLRHPEATRFNLSERFGQDAINIGAQNVTNVQSTQDSIALNAIGSNAIIIASSGMAAGGRILHHLRNRLPRQQDTICLVGYQATATLGQQLLAGRKQVKVMGLPIAVNATITQIDGFSAHADRGELLRWFGNFTSSPKTFIVHSDPGPAASLAAAVNAQYGFEVSAARQGEVVEI